MVKLLLSFSVSALLLSGMALLNGGPIYYIDTAAYLIDADKIAHLKAPFAVRPVFYGLFIWPFHWGTIFFPVIFLQAFVVTHIIYLSVRVCVSKVEPIFVIIIVLALTLLTSISFYVSQMLPDIFVSVFILTLFLLGFGISELAPVEIGYLFVLAAACASFHLTALPVGLAISLTSLIVSTATGRSLKTPVRVVAPVIVSLVLLLGFSMAVFRQTTLTPKNPPHLLARILADGPGRDFLREECRRSRFTLCQYQDRLTSVEDEFLWRLLPSIPPADGYNIKAEQNAVILGTITRFPVQVLKRMVLNTLRQLITFQSQTQVSQTEWDEFQASETPLAGSVSHSWQARRLFEKPALDLVNGIQGGVVAVCFAISLVLIVEVLRAGLFLPAALAATVYTGLLANAFACGALGGVFSRYQGRVIWLLPFTTVIAGLALLRYKSGSRSAQRQARSHELEILDGSS